MIEKRYLKSKPICKVKFSLSKADIESAKNIAVVGDFNNWDITANPLRKQKSGVFSSTVDLEIDRSYQFRYVLDGKIWINDTEADSFVPSNVSLEQNCLLDI
ncbi:isoamylase early set domain-containing protein [Marinomonas sp. 2405UD68-3]|uniref:isoamylase early set domain-containing protein n=1 Tax=Marinomonas sp. 2405UD68-3 TaxID=3391835 RepID=UPI0039C9ABFC